MKVAVIGCGYGRESALIAPHVDHVYGIDVSKKILDTCVTFLAEHGVDNFKPILAENWRTDLPGEIDFFYSITVFQHLTRDLTRDYILGIAAKLTRGGRAFCQFACNPLHTEDADLRDYEPDVGWTADQITALIKESGLNLYSLSADRGILTRSWAYFGR